MMSVYSFIVENARKTRSNIERVVVCFTLCICSAINNRLPFFITIPEFSSLFPVFAK